MSLIEKTQLTLIDRICRSLVDEGLITVKQLSDATKHHKKTGVSLGRALVRQGYIDEKTLMAYVAGQLEIPEVNLSNLHIETQVLKLIPEDTARRRLLIPVSKSAKSLTVAMANPGDIFALEELKLQVGLEIKPVYADEDSIFRAINKNYRGAYSIERTARSIGKSNIGMIDDEEETNSAKLTRITKQPPIVKLVDEIILEGLLSGASDVHIEPQREATKVRYRIDGMLHTISTLPKHLAMPVISRLKILAEMDVTEKREPQDGQIIRDVGGEEANLRISTFPTTHGEKAAIRIMGKGACSMDLAASGLHADNLELVKRLTAQPNGLMLVCGPTGCGKTTTLYSLLNILNNDEANIVTLEDPVEFDVPNVNQAQIYPKRGMNFANGLRAILRQDPNVIMVGEIRDLETADLAIRASLTGHLVLSTLHTNDALGVITRLTDMGFDEFLISSALSGAIAQRLVRTICPKCKEEYAPTVETLVNLGLSVKKKFKFYRGAGCDDCRHTGYKGRTGLYEVLYLDDTMRQMILKKKPEPEIRRVLASNGFRTLFEDGLEKIIAGITTVDEVMRETKTADGLDAELPIALKIARLNPR
jgi:type IV pilus assembly protein PilB